MAPPLPRRTSLAIRASAARRLPPRGRPPPPCSHSATAPTASTSNSARPKGPLSRWDICLEEPLSLGASGCAWACSVGLGAPPRLGRFRCNQAGREGRTMALPVAEAPAAHVTAQGIGAGMDTRLRVRAWAHWPGPAGGSCGLFKLAPEPERRHWRGPPSGRGRGAADLRHRATSCHAATSTCDSRGGRLLTRTGQVESGSAGLGIEGR